MAFASATGNLGKSSQTSLFFKKKLFAEHEEHEEKLVTL